ncbi:MAG TPA: zinc ribbon domain-containing protein [Verrucomicrobiota bacterium]|nr:zinc ribbon domain-containing protein [Verrucomicrobiota bacterium]
MPTYDYECGHCGHRFERRQRMSDPPLQTCPACGKEVRRQFGAGAGVILKGGRKSHGSGAPCAWESTGQTCCGRSARCNSGGCEF